MDASRRQCWLGCAWVTGLALLWLVCADAWLFPVQVISLWPGLAAGPHFAEFVRTRIVDAGGVAAILATAFAVGATVTARALPQRDLLTALLALAVGLWLLAVAVLVVGAFSTAWVSLCLAGGAAWLWPGPRRFVRECRGETDRLSGWAKFLLACAIGAAALNLPGTLAPPFEYDELEYHLGAPAEYLRAGRIIFLPHNFYSNLPQLAEMLYWLGLATSSDGAAKLLHWTFGVLAALAVYAIGTRLWNRSVGVVAAALFYCLPFVQDLSQTARVDLATTFFAVVACGALLVFETGGGARRYLWWSALAAGAAVATKWTAVPVVLLPCVIVLVARRRWAVALGYLLLAILPVVPWLAKNWALAGNPVYPLLTNLWPSPHWNAAQGALFAERHYPSFDWRGLGEFFERPWHYSFAEPRAAPLLLMAAPLILLTGRRGAAAGVTGGLFLAGYAGWYLFTFRPWRFLFPMLPLAALVGAVALDRAGRPARVVVGAVVVVGLSLLALNNLVDAEQPERVPARLSFTQFALGRVSPDEFVARMGGGVLEPVVWMNDRLPATATVLYVGEARVAAAQHAVVWATAFDQHPLVTRLPRLQESGVTHIYISFPELKRLQTGYGYLQDLDWSQFRRFLQQHTREVFRSPVGVVYELRSPSCPRGGEDTGEGVPS